MFLNMNSAKLHIPPLNHVQYCRGNFAPDVHGGVMVCPAVPGPAHVVRHDVDEVERPRDPGHVVALVDAEVGGGHGGGEEAAALVELRAELLKESGEVLPKNEDNIIVETTV